MATVFFSHLHGNNFGVLCWVNKLVFARFRPINKVHLGFVLTSKSLIFNSDDYGLTTF